MAPSKKDIPLRRSEVGMFRENTQNIEINDDDEERRQARRRTIMQQTINEQSNLDENETLKKCLAIFNENKLSRDNAWSLSLIDTLSNLLDRHHKSLNNFKVAGSSLEASSMVYGLRVDSIHTDVLRMSAGLSAKQYLDNDMDNDDDDNSTTPDAQVAAADKADGAVDENDNRAAKQKQRRQRRQVSTVTKNKDTLNARLETVPMHDPVFGKLNSKVGSINSSIRLMNNILPTRDGEIKLSTHFPFWDGEDIEDCDYTLPVEYSDDMECTPCDVLLDEENYEELQLRPVHSGYIISDATPARNDSRRGSISDNANSADEERFHPFPNSDELSMAFDINAECEPVSCDPVPPMVDVDFDEFNDLTTEQITAIQKCRGLRRQPEIIDDLRPIDSTSQLEYSYRPLDKISQFWAGPSHWKFKKTRQRSTLLNIDDNQSGRPINQRMQRAQNALAKKRSKILKFEDFHDEFLFLKIDDKFKMRRANIQKKWDQRKLKLPTDLGIDPNVFSYYILAPSLVINPITKKGQATNESGGIIVSEGLNTEEPHFGDNDDTLIENDFPSDMNTTNDFADPNTLVDVPNTNDTILEITTEFDGAPNQVHKVVVPYAKRAKVIDMKNLKKCCKSLIEEEMKKEVRAEELLIYEKDPNENYETGIAKFSTVYRSLPNRLTQTNSESLSPAVAFYSVLHLANENNLRLIGQEDALDMQIRQIKCKDK